LDILESKRVENGPIYEHLTLKAVSYTEWAPRYKWANCG